MILLTSTPRPSSSGSTVIFSVVVYGNPATATGTVTLTDSIAGSLGTVTLSGGAGSLSVALATGSHTVTANYSGDGNYSSGTATLVQTVIGVATSTPMVGFSIIAAVSNEGDTGLPPSAQMNVFPSPTPASTPFNLIWYASSNIDQIRITNATSNTVITNPPMVTSSGSGVIRLSGVSSQTAYVLECFDQSGNPVTSGSNNMVATCIVNPI